MIVVVLALACDFHALRGAETREPRALTAAFSTEGHTVYHLRTARRGPAGGHALISAAYDGTVLAHTPEGELLWKHRLEGHFPFDLAVGDIDGDGGDDIFVATAGGTVEALNVQGRLLWSYATPNGAILYQVTPVRLPTGEWRIITGGVNEELLALDASGKLVARLPAGDVVRLIGIGNIRGNGRDYVAFTTTSSARSGQLSLTLLDPATMQPVWRTTDLGKRSTGQARRRFFDLLVQDVDGDGSDEIVLSGGNDENGIIYAFDGGGKSVFASSDPKIPNISYRMNLLRHVKLPKDEFILGHFGNVLIVYEPDGRCREVIRGTYATADAWFEPALKTLFLASSVSGGDGVYALRLDRSSWKSEFVSLEPVGKLARIKENVRRLEQQLEHFSPPDYQPRPRNVDVISRPPEQTFPHLNFIRAATLSQKIESRDHVWSKEIDRRRRYDLEADEIVARVEALEAAGQDFVLWAGHGAAIYFPWRTFERVIKAAPRRLRGFVFAEMERVDAHMQQVVEEIILPLAELCRANGMLIVLRNKNIFWNGPCYLPLWKDLLTTGRFRDVIVPGMEETNSRTHELSLAARVGLWHTGRFDRWLGRATTDNANFDRMHEWGAQETITHHLRNLILSASLGADIFYNTLEIADLAFEMEEDTSPQYAQLSVFYRLLATGALRIPRRDELLSISPVAIAMRSPPDSDFIRHGINGHTYNLENRTLPPMVFDRLDCYWGGAPIADHDLSGYAYATERRMLNFLPKMPHGFVRILPEEVARPTSTGATDYIVTDGRFFYGRDGRLSPAEGKSFAVERLGDGASRLPLRIEGDAAWSAVRISPNHVRVTLVDPGYLDPADRQVRLHFQGLQPTACRDLLEGRAVPIRDRTVEVTVPAGTLAILDVQHR